MKDWALYVAYRMFAIFISLLSRDRMIRAARRMALGYYRVDARGRRIGTENLKRVFPEKSDEERRQLLIRSYQLQATALLEALWARKLDDELAATYLEGADAFKELVRKLDGKGALFATAHYGSWEMANIATGALGAPKTTVIARELPNPRIDRHMTKMRERTGNEIVGRANAILACMRAVKRGEFVASVIDMTVLPERGGQFADFLGTPALTSPALPLLAVRTGAPLYFSVCEPIGHGHRYVLRMEEIDVQRTGDRDADIAHATLELNRALERAILRYPDPWIWGYKRWKWRPAEMNGNSASYSTWIHDHW